MGHGDRGMRVVGAAMFILPFASCVPPPTVVKGPSLSICTRGFATAAHAYPCTETVPGMSAGPQGLLPQWPLNTPWW